jgi:hypothetical protein
MGRESVKESLGRPAAAALNGPPPPAGHHGRRGGGPARPWVPARQGGLR